MGYCDLREGELFVHEGKQETRTIKKGFIPSIVKAVRKTARPASLCVCETPASILSVTPALNSLFNLKKTHKNTHVKFPQSTSNRAVIGREGDPSKQMLLVHLICKTNSTDQQTDEAQVDTLTLSVLTARFYLFLKRSPRGGLTAATGFDFSLRPFAACLHPASLSPFTVTVHPNKAPQNIYMVDRKAKSFGQSMT